jgi:hypothetical protein
MIKALFLDVDGVLNSDDYQFCSGKWNMSKKSQIDPTSIPLLNQIIAATNAKIVVSSTWRSHRTLRGKRYMEYKMILKRRTEVCLFF